MLGAFVFSPASALADFQLGLYDPLLGLASTNPQSPVAYGVFNQVAASTVRIQLQWKVVAPVVLPAGFDPTNPADPHYRWTGIDAAVRAAAQHGARPLVDIYGAPAWAQPAGAPPTLPAGVAWNPDANQYGAFALALARRYSGQFPDPLNPGTNLPRVKLWEIWNEENANVFYLAAPDLVGEYRSLLNAAYSSIKSVHSDSVVAIGGLSPVFVKGEVVAPLQFAASLMCLRRVHTHYVRSHPCPVKAHFDVLAVHPYALAVTPTKHAYHYDDTLVADMGKVRTLLTAAKKLHSVSPNIDHPLWVTEWEWYSNPPVPSLGDPPNLAARYTAWSMYEFWRTGTSLVTWYDLFPLASGAPISPLVDVPGQPSLKQEAFGFPVIAVVKRHGYVWGRAPVKHRVKVFVQHLVKGRWRSVGSVRTKSDGVFQLSFKARGNGFYRAKIRHGGISLPYNSRSIPARQTHPFSNVG